MLTEEQKDLLRSNTFAHLAVLDDRGRPHSTIVWVDVEGERVLINTALGRVKERALQPGAQVALSAADPANPYRYLGLQGRVADRRREDGATVIDRLSEKYTGRTTYAGARDGRVTVTIEPERVWLSG